MQDKLLHLLPHGTLHPTTCKVVNAVGVFGQLQHTRTSQWAEIVHREHMQIILIHPILAIDHKAAIYHDLSYRLRIRRHIQ